MIGALSRCVDVIGPIRKIGCQRNPCAGYIPTSDSPVYEELDATALIIMITVVSRWKLKCGVPPELADALKLAAHKYEKAEPGTSLYFVNLAASKPLGPDLRPARPACNPVKPEDQSEVVFIEKYPDADAFAAHVNGPVFSTFRTRYLKHFLEDPEQPGWPKRETLFLEEQSGFARGV